MRMKNEVDLITVRAQCCVKRIERELQRRHRKKNEARSPGSAGTGEVLRMKGISANDVEGILLHLKSCNGETPLRVHTSTTDTRTRSACFPTPPAYVV